MKTTTKFICAMVYPWKTILAGGKPLEAPPKGPKAFIPVFETREDALEWENNPSIIMEIELTL